jgi:D-alanyl-D-alanine carboxypeptidase
VRNAKGTVRNYTAGVADIETGKTIKKDAPVRIASNTKTFTATVVLQLVQEGKIALDAPVETYLPGIVRGEGIDGRAITVRQLLNHTSGLADYDLALFAEGPLSKIGTYFEPRELVDIVLREPALAAPGAAWSYSNGNYILAGLVVQKVTGRPISEEITKRIIEPLGLEDTYWPAVGDMTLPRNAPTATSPRPAAPRRRHRARPVLRVGRRSTRLHPQRAQRFLRRAARRRADRPGDARRDEDDRPVPRRQRVRRGERRPGAGQDLAFLR